MPDILPNEVPLVRRIEEAARRLFRLYGYEEIRTPLFEETRLFVRGIGEDTDIVAKEMYTFEDKVGPMFRKERPQAGRLRQFYQIGGEAIGSYEPAVDAEAILLATRFFREVGLDGIVVKLNSLGCPSCRGEYRKALRAALEPKRKELCRDCQARFERNVFRILDCKQEPCKAVAMDAPAMREFLDRECRGHLEAVESMLKDSGLDFINDDHLVRGFDYYTRTLFEISHGSPGARDAVCGGGRYDNLVEELGGPAVGCVGFAVGVVPTVLALQKAGVARAAPEPLKLYAAAVNDDVRSECFRIVEDLREAGISADLDHERRSLKAQMRSANRLGAQYVLVIGPDELAQGRLTLKEMATGREERLSIGDVIKSLKRE